MIRDAAAGPGAAQDGLVTHAEPVMGTVVSFALVPGELPGPDLRAALRAACAVLSDADRVFSTWDPGSPLSRLRRGARPTTAPPVMAEVLTACEQARDASGGWFDPWAMPGGYDPTGLVKGWAVGQALRTLDQAGVPAALVNGGGDLAAFGEPAPGRRWRVGIRHPWSASALAGIIEVEAAVATSGSYERGAHLIDPATGMASGRAASATVTGPSLAMADALATAVAVGGDEALAVVGGIGGYAAYLSRPDGSERATAGFTFVS